MNTGLSGTGWKRNWNVVFGVCRNWIFNFADSAVPGTLISSIPSRPVDAILTSPPYMRQLDYGRDNRLRLWFLGCDDWHALDKTISPREQEFLTLMERCFKRWKTVLKPGGYCVLVIGNECSREDRRNLPRDVVQTATSTVGGYSLVSQHTETIPNDRRVRRGILGSTSETILVLRNGRLPVGAAKSSG